MDQQRRPNAANHGPEKLVGKQGGPGDSEYMQPAAAGVEKEGKKVKGFFGSKKSRVIMHVRVGQLPVGRQLNRGS